MFFQKHLQAELEGRCLRLLATDYRFIDTEVAYLRQYLDTVPALLSITSVLEGSLPDLDPANWINGHVTRGGIKWPPTEEGRAKVAWTIIRDWAAGKLEMRQIGGWFSWESNFNSMSRDVVTGLIKPFVHYLLDRLGTESGILYLLERYRRRLEWFEGERLYRQYLDARDSGQGEKVFERDLQQYLFDQGVDYPFSQPRAAEGRADLVADLETDDPLVCEVKLFDGERYGVKR